MLIPWNPGTSLSRERCTARTSASRCWPSTASCLLPIRLAHVFMLKIYAVVVAGRKAGERWSPGRSRGLLRRCQRRLRDQPPREIICEHLLSRIGPSSMSSLHSDGFVSIGKCGGLWLCRILGVRRFVCVPARARSLPHTPLVCLSLCEAVDNTRSKHSLI